MDVNAEDKSDSAKAAELRRRRILGSEADRMEKLTGHKQTQKQAEKNELKKDESDLDTLKKQIPIRKLKQQCLLKLLVLIAVFFAGVFSRVFESKQKPELLRHFIHRLCTMPPFNNLSKAWATNDELQLKTVRYSTWVILITLVFFRTPPPAQKPEKEEEDKESEEPKIPEVLKIPQEFKDTLSHIGQWLSAILILFFFGYDITYNFIV